MALVRPKGVQTRACPRASAQEGKAREDPVDRGRSTMMMKALTLLGTVALESAEATAPRRLGRTACTADEITTFISISGHCQGMHGNALDECVTPYVHRLTRTCVACVGEISDSSNDVTISDCIEGHMFQCRCSDITPLSQALEICAGEGDDVDDVCLANKLDELSDPCELCLYEFDSVDALDLCIDCGSMGSSSTATIGAIMAADVSMAEQQEQSLVSRASCADYLPVLSFVTPQGDALGLPFYDVGRVAARQAIEYALASCTILMVGIALAVAYRSRRKHSRHNHLKDDSANDRAAVLGDGHETPAETEGEVDEDDEQVGLTAPQ
eukprot:COSAG02_NODE_5653_length_4149_cov_3.358765_2_plen_327_part_00